jgi:hypothetical protein
VLGALGARRILFPEPTEPKFARPAKILNYSNTKGTKVETQNYSDRRSLRTSFENRGSLIHGLKSLESAMQP